MLQEAITRFFCEPVRADDVTIPYRVQYTASASTYQSSVVEGHPHPSRDDLAEILLTLQGKIAFLWPPSRPPHPLCFRHIAQAWRHHPHRYTLDELLLTLRQSGLRKADHGSIEKFQTQPPGLGQHPVADSSLLEPTAPSDIITREIYGCIVQAPVNPLVRRIRLGAGEDETTVP